MAQQVVILCAERARRAPLVALCTEYVDRMERYNICARLEECTGRSVGGQQAAAVRQQSECLLRRLRDDDYVLLLDERGRQYRSTEFAQMLGELLAGRQRRIVFVIGGAYGVGEQLRQRANVHLSLGPMTLPHEIARLVLCEQLYRALTILRGEPYHHGGTIGG